MPKLLKFIALILVLFSGPAFAQLELGHAPRDKAFLARDRDSDTCTYTLKGKVTDWAYTKLEVNIYRDGNFYRKYWPYLRYANGDRVFEQDILLPAGRHFYGIEYVLVGSTNDTMQVDSILVGDVYLVQGQSNAVAGDYKLNQATAFDSAYYSPYLRSFGTSTANWIYSSNDSGWYNIEASKYSTRGAVGQWAAVMARVILDSFDMPVCLLNGAVGGTPITYHVPDPSDHYNVVTNYGRLLNRTRMADLQDRIKGIFYFQGESDGSNAVGHDTLFRAIVEAWKDDYDGFEKLYVIQVRAGCGLPSLELRDVQRRFGQTIERCQTVSANGLNGHDGCHYNFKDGYELLGHQLAAIVGRDIYNSGRKNVDPPTIAAAVYEDSDRKTIRLIMANPGDLVFVDSGFHTLFKVEGDPNVAIVGGELRYNQVILNLNRSGCSDLYLSYDGSLRVQPWVKSKTLMGMPSFYRIPVQSVIADQELFACRGEYVTLGAPALPGYSYQWKDLTTGARSTSAQWKLKINTSTTCRLIAGYTTVNCSSADTLYFKVHVDSVRLPVFKEQYIVCPGESVQLKPDTSYWRNFAWNTDESWDYSIDSALSVQWNGTSRAGCTYTDSFTVRLVDPNIMLEDTIMICEGRSTTIELSGFNTYYWNRIEGDSFYNAGAGELDIVVEETGCTDSAHIWILEYARPFQPDWHFSVCANEVLRLLRPDDVISWSIDDSIQDSEITVVQEGITAIEWVDSNLCRYVDTLVRADKPLPQTEVLTDTGFCMGDSIQILVGPPRYFYVWSDSAGNLNQRIIARGGSYTVEVIDTNDCRIGRYFTAEEWPEPSLDRFRDTVLCKDSVWTISLPDSLNYTVNGRAVIEQVTFFPDNTYAVNVVNDFRCMNTKSITVGSMDCNVHVQAMTKNEVYIHPNPVRIHEVLHISGNPLIKRIMLYDALGKQVMAESLNKDNIRIGEPGVYILSITFGSGETMFRKILAY